MPYKDPEKKKANNKKYWSSYSKNPENEERIASNKNDYMKEYRKRKDVQQRESQYAKEYNNKDVFNFLDDQDGASQFLVEYLRQQKESGKFIDCDINRTRARKFHIDTLPALLSLQGFYCAYCWKQVYGKIELLEIDHIIPVSKGGNDLVSNLSVVCSDCNKRKSNKENEFLLPLIRCEFSVLVGRC